jgi:cell division initiation protein
VLTPQEVSGKEFVKAVFGGYDMSVVDDFLETLTADYSTLYKENAILKSKIKVLVEKVEEYRSTEDAMRMALLTAQRLGDDITAEARRKSETLLSQTEADIRDRLLEMKSKYADEDARLKSLKEETRKFVVVSQEIIRQHSLFLARVEGLGREPEPERASAPEPEESAMPAIERSLGAEKQPEQAWTPTFERTPAAEKPQGRTKEEEISDTARQIDDAIYRITDAESDPFTPLFKDEESSKLFRPKQAGEKPEDDEPTSPRPKFDFSNLKFGPNYSGD